MPPDFRRVSYSTKEGIVIWYVLSCKAQEEYEILEFCNSHISKKAMKKGFVLTYDRMRRFEGSLNQSYVYYAPLKYHCSQTAKILPKPPKALVHPLPSDL